MEGELSSTFKEVKSVYPGGCELWCSDPKHYFTISPGVELSESGYQQEQKYLDV